MANGSLNGKIVVLQSKCSGHVMDAGLNKELCQWGRNDSIQQRFQLKHIEENKYHIISETDGKAVDVDGFDIIKYDFHGGNNQQWLLEGNDEDGFVIETLLGNGYAIEVPNSCLDQGCKLALAPKNGGESQKFLCQKVEGCFDKEVVYFRNKWTKLVIDVDSGRHLRQMNRNDGNQQQFKLVHVTGKKYHIISEEDDKAVEVLGGLNEDKAEIVVADFHGGINQQWILEETECGGFTIESAIGDRGIDVPHPDEGCNLILWKKHGGNNQIFYIDVAE